MKRAALALAAAVALALPIGCSSPVTWQSAANVAITADTVLVTVAYAAIQAQGIATPDLCKPEDVAAANAAFAQFQSASASARAAVAASDETAATAALTEMALATAEMLRIKAKVCPFLNDKKS